MTKKASQLSRIAAAISVATLFGCGGGATTSTDIDVVDPAAPVSDWELVWSDEFDGNSIDDDNWTHEVCPQLSRQAGRADTNVLLDLFCVDRQLVFKAR